MEIKVLGPGCPKCQQTEQTVMDALQEAGVAADVEKVTGTMEIAKYGVFGTPTDLTSPSTTTAGVPNTGCLVPLPWWWTEKSNRWVRFLPKRTLKAGFKRAEQLKS